MIFKSSKKFFAVPIVIILAALTTINVSAVPAYPGPYTVTKPDGTAITAYMHGDERLHYMADKDGFVIERDSSGDYVYKTVDIPILYSSPRITVPGIDSRPSSALHMSAVTLPESTQNLPIKMSAPAEVPASSSITCMPLLTIMIEFSDMKLDDRYSESYFYDKFYNKTMDKSVNNYYDEMSSGSFQYSPVKTDTNEQGIVKVSLSTPHPQVEMPENESSMMNLLHTLCYDAMNAADPHVDFAPYDTNSDGYITTDEMVIAFIVAGYEAAASIGIYEYSVWAHQWCAYTKEITCDGKKMLRGEVLPDKSVKIGNYIMMGELLGDFFSDYPDCEDGITLPLPPSRKLSKSFEIGTLCHELGHTLGLPDLYNTISQSGEALLTEPAVGALSLMASGSWGYVEGQMPGGSPSYLDPWCRIFLGWLNPIELSSGETGIFELGSISSGNESVYVIPTSDENEFFYVENRQLAGFDSGLSELGIRSGGLAIWHIDIDILNKYFSNNKINSYYPEQGIMTVQHGFVPYTGTIDQGGNYRKDPVWRAALYAKYDPLWYRESGRFNALSLGSIPTSRCNADPSIYLNETSALDAPRQDSGVRIEVLSESGPSMKFSLQNQDLDIICSRTLSTATMRIINNTAAPLIQTMTPIVAVYDSSGALKTLAGGATTISAPAYGYSGQIIFNNLPEGSGFHYKFYLWNSTDTMNPLVNSFLSD